MRQILHILLVMVMGSTIGCSHVIVQDASYYAESPHQLKGPDGSIPRGTPVTILGEKSGYKYVWAANGTLGYVWDRALVTQQTWNALKRGRDPAYERSRRQKSPRREPIIDLGEAPSE